jgi:hypothetical protein
MVDALEQDYLTVPGQNYACLSIVGPDCPQKTEKFGIKIRGTFVTREDAERHAKRLQKDDATFDIYVVDMYKWLLIPPDRDHIDDVHYADDKLEEIMTKYRDNQRLAASMFEKRKRDMIAKPIPGSDTPYIDASDENSKFYTKPDVPPIPHPAEIVEELRKEFPDKTVQELVGLADAKVSEEIERRAKENISKLVKDEEPTPAVVVDSAGADAGSSSA